MMKNQANGSEQVIRVPVGAIVASESAFQQERRSRRAALEADRGALGPMLEGMESPEESLAALALSIEANGVIEPLIVRALPDGKTFGLIAGERRWLASQRAGLREVPVIVREFATEIEVLGQQITENLHRDDCSVIEEAVGIQELMDRHGLRQEAVGRLLGRSQQDVSKRLGLLRLPPMARDAVARRRVSINTAQLLLRVPVERMAEALDEITAPVHAPENPLNERSATAWLQDRYLRPVEEREKWENRAPELLGMFGARPEDVLPFEECWPWWSVGESEPHYDAPWRLAEDAVPDPVLRKVGLVGIVSGKAATWGGLAKDRGNGGRVYVARDGRGSPVLVVKSAELMPVLVQDFEERLKGYATAQGIGLGTARQHVSQGRREWFAFHGVEGGAGSEDRGARDGDAGADEDEETGTPHGVPLFSGDERELVNGIRLGMAGRSMKWWKDEPEARACLAAAMAAICPAEFDPYGADTPGQVAGLVAEIYLSTLESGGDERKAELARFGEVFGMN